MKMVSMVLDTKEAHGQSLEAQEMEAPKYPYGTCLHLDEAALKKLGIKEMPPVGTKLTIEAMACVTGTSEREYEGGKHCNLDLQLTDLAIEPAKKTKGDVDMEKTARKIYE